ncbi:MAG TPA: hypothetical protein VMD05_05160, partial [Candidatus Nanoarchaeia archaeon]|nr:hypothetical protein [Candidatus Nanoarchaeia archaeon]
FSVTWGGTTGDTLTLTVTPVLPGKNQIYPQGYIYFEPTRRVQKMVINNGFGFGQINVFDGSRLLTGLRYGDTIQLNNTGDSQVSVLYTVDSVGHYRLSGDSGISVILTTVPLRKAGDSRGTVRLYGGAWGMNYPLYTFLNESFSAIKVK